MEKEGGGDRREGGKGGRRWKAKKWRKGKRKSIQQQQHSSYVACNAWNMCSPALAEKKYFDLK